MEQLVIVTGASGNLGAATAHAFQQGGAKTVLVDRSSDRLAKVFPDLGQDHLLAGGIDLTSPEALDRVVADVLNRFGRIDVLVNTVGAWRGGKAVHEASLDDWDFLFEANLRTTLVACRAVAPRMILQRSGRIINVASRDALKGSAGYAAYSASKTAVIRLTESLADELKTFNITANCILPSTIDTRKTEPPYPKPISQSRLNPPPWLTSSSSSRPTPRALLLAPLCRSTARVKLC
jgi:NAD(P)-dependent dehydrogenase (short-subunit alcohol dehydrogenase family)